MKLGTILGALTIALSGLLPAGQGAAEEASQPVVVELFTSQGCSTCPPADELLHELAAREDVIALALHVDYWDYIGWKDEFALPQHTARQRGYARVAGRRMIYTPQMIINGTDHVVGNHPMDVTDLIALHEKRARPVALDLDHDGGTVTISARAAADVPKEIRVLLVHYEPLATVDILRGENAGRTLSYANIVQRWEELGRWDGTGEFRASVPAQGAAVVLVQAADYGPILAAQRLD